MPGRWRVVLAHVPRHPLGGHRRIDQRITRLRAPAVDVDREVGPRADQADRCRAGDPAIPKSHGQRQRQSTARRITHNHKAFRLDPIVDQRSVDRDHLLERNRIARLRRPRVVGHQRRHSGRIGQPRHHAAITLRAAQCIRATVQVQQRRAGVHPRRSHPLHRHARDGDAVVARIPWHPSHPREQVVHSALAADSNPGRGQQFSAAVQRDAHYAWMDPHAKASTRVASKDSTPSSTGSSSSIRESFS